MLFNIAFSIKHYSCFMRCKVREFAMTVFNLSPLFWGRISGRYFLSRKFTMLVHSSSIHRRAGASAPSRNIISIMWRYLSRLSIDMNTRKRRNNWVQWRNESRKAHRQAACDDTHRRAAIGKSSRCSLIITVANTVVVITWSISQSHPCDSRPSRLMTHLRQPFPLSRSVIVKMRHLENGEWYVECLYCQCIL